MNGPAKMCRHQSGLAANIPLLLLLNLFLRSILPISLSLLIFLSVSLSLFHSVSLSPPSLSPFLPFSPILFSLSLFSLHIFLSKYFSFICIVFARYHNLSFFFSPSFSFLPTPVSKLSLPPSLSLS